MRTTMPILLTLACLLGAAAPALAGTIPDAFAPAPGAPAPADRAGWLLARADLQEPAAGRQGEIGGSRGGAGPSGEGGGFGTVLPVLASLAVPGAGHLMIGNYVAGVPLVALDAYSWLRLKHNHDRGGEVRQEYLDFAEAHWSEQQLDAAFDPLSEWDWQNGEYAGIGRRAYFFPDVQSKEDLQLWVSREDDEREWFENLGKWDQFVFGWDDFRDPATLAGFDPATGIANLRLAGVSNNRELYRDLRELSNDHFERRDRYIYLNIATRLVSAFHVAWLQGLLGGEPRGSLAIGGHDVDIVAQPVGFTGSRLALAVSY